VRANGIQESLSNGSRIVDRPSQHALEQARFVTASRVLGAEAVITELPQIHNRLVSIPNSHADRRPNRLIPISVPRSWLLCAEIVRNFPKLLQRRLQILDNLLRDHAGRGEVVADRSNLASKSSRSPSGPYRSSHTFSLAAHLPFNPPGTSVLAMRRTS
jgi:hypothetical protein